MLELQNSITRKNIKNLMTLFYERAICDKELGPFFIHELGDDIASEDWKEHIELLADFWLAKLLGEKTYKGDLSGAHIRVPHIKKESFMKWIELFSASADEVYVSDISDRFKEKGLLFSEQFMRDLNI
ncbi:group III truncated hemoglobin [Candidatus Sulfurimonas marisnigri]|uniref:Group III truncated hemoglobin n=1 Tax=Candidatus Sulfurimonas marisnigri TaxID=2740405 RepID=A0A7S7LY32_9BACT|nr:group III truncated hemoglobin [Candidatus Sulfurimonas marisnigri]QOY53603.1 group III truncated hemoglobin [Candidatus Sulfurimonas marisnigri]